MFSDISNKFQQTWKAKDEFIKNGTFDPTNPKHWNIPAKENSSEELDLEEQITKVINRFMRESKIKQYNIQQIEKIYEYLMIHHKSGEKDVYNEQEILTDLRKSTKFGALKILF